DLCNLLGDQAELRDTDRIKLVLVAEGHRLQGQDCFARLVHRLDLILEPLRGGYRAELTVRIYNDPDASGHSHSVNARDKGVHMSSHPADANCVVLAGNTNVAYIDIVTAGRKSPSRISPQGDVERASRVLAERALTVSGIADAGCVASERML